jgi:hypothetical protein
MAKDPNQSPERVYQIYDGCKNFLLNKKYYGKRLARYRFLNFWMEMFIALGATGSGVAGFAVWQTGYGQYAWATLAAISIILSIAKPLLGLSTRIENYAKVYGEYSSAFAKMSILVDDLQVHRRVTPDLMTAFSDLRTRTAELVALDDPSPDPNLIREIQIDVNATINIEGLWVPAE